MCICDNMLKNQNQKRRSRDITVAQRAKREEWRSRDISVSRHKNVTATPFCKNLTLRYYNVAAMRLGCFFATTIQNAR